MRSCSFGIVSFLSAFVFSSFFVRVSLSFPVSPSRSLFHLSLCPFRFSTTAVRCEIVPRLSSSILSITTRRITLLGPLVLRFRVEKDCGAPQPVFSSSLVLNTPSPHALQLAISRHLSHRVPWLSPFGLAHHRLAKIQRPSPPHHRHQPSLHQSPLSRTNSPPPSPPSWLR